MIEHIDYFQTDPNQFKEMKCLVCGSICDVKRGLPGATFLRLYYYYLYNKKEEFQNEELNDSHDFFSCPNIDKKWHLKASRLKLQFFNSESPSLKNIMEEDLKNIVQQNL